MSASMIPELTANLKELARGQPDAYRRLYHHLMEALDDSVQHPELRDPSFSKAGGQAQDVIEDILREEEENVMSILHFHLEWKTAVRDMVCLVALERRARTSSAVDAADDALQSESPIVLSRLRNHFVERIGDDYH
ncbi:26ad6f8e-a4aa-4f2c-8938-9cf101188626 [Thermothielavioides terrestris]|uniref:26ad6f8e-a4aa-4f2c-8938-9cf101188626 n=1 Tax=Thermothielavioides terrestris TaxID=2587410 RepID=A0A3S4EZC7_9PEZI|nr:26ad6f8e-a4aa-4f2c-8938-9cf101188626 [Thermothielavioides terrestris]